MCKVGVSHPETLQFHPAQTSISVSFSSRLDCFASLSPLSSQLPLRTLKAEMTQMARPNYHAVFPKPRITTWMLLSSFISRFLFFSFSPAAEGGFNFWGANGDDLMGHVSDVRESLAFYRPTCLWRRLKSLHSQQTHAERQIHTYCTSTYIFSLEHMDIYIL